MVFTRSEGLVTQVGEKSSTREMCICFLAFNLEALARAFERIGFGMGVRFWYLASALLVTLHMRHSVENWCHMPLPYDLKIFDG